MIPKFDAMKTTRQYIHILAAHWNSFIECIEIISNNPPKPPIHSGEDVEPWNDKVVTRLYKGEMENNRCLNIMTEQSKSQNND